MDARRKASFRAARTETHAMIELSHGSTAIQAHLTAAELEQLIGTLARIRADLKPEVPRQKREVSAIISPPLSIKRDALSAMIAVCFGHPGFGWQGFALPEPVMRELIERLQSACEVPSPVFGRAN